MRKTIFHYERTYARAPRNQERGLTRREWKALPRVDRWRLEPKPDCSYLSTGYRGRVVYGPAGKLP